MPAPSRRQLLLLAGVSALAGCGRAATKALPSRSAPTSSGSSSTTPPATGTPSATRPTSTPTHTGPATEVSHGDRAGHQVAFTFHGAGDPVLARQLLEAAEAGHAPVTVFAIGTWLVANPTIAARILAGGHELANHTYTHPSDMPQLPAAAVQTEVARCRDVLRQQTGSPGRWVRPSAVQFAPAQVLAGEGAAGYATSVAYDVDPLDYTDPGADAIVRRATAMTKAGSILSLHLGHPGTIAAMPRLLAMVATKGLTPVTVSTLLA